MEEQKDKRQRILEAAALIFSQRGYHLARVEEIAVQAGVGKGTVYEYFASKLELFQEMFRSMLRKYFQELETRRVTTGSIVDRLERVLEVHLDFMMNNRHLARASFVDGAFMDEELSRWMYRQRQDKMAVIQTLFLEAMDRNEIRRVDAEILAEMFTGAMGAVIIPVLMEEKQIDPHEVSSQLLDILLYGIRGQACDI